MSAVGVLLLVFIAKALVETLPEKDRKPFEPIAWIKDYTSESKMRNSSAFKTKNFALKTRNCALQTRNFVSKMMNFAGCFNLLCQVTAIWFSF